MGTSVTGDIVAGASVVVTAVPQAASNIPKTTKTEKNKVIRFIFLSPS
jgi:hypothetical protein